MRIGDVADEVGLSVSTLRAWERRYGVLRPARTAGGHRVYGDEDVARVRQMQAQISAGRTVAAAAAALTANAPTAADRVDDVVVLRALASARHRIVQASESQAVVDAVAAFVADVGGTVVPAGDESDENTVPLDLGFGAASPRLASAAPFSVARMRLEQTLPELAEDARTAMQRLRVMGPADQARGVPS